MSEEKYVLEESVCSSGSLCMGYNVNGAHMGAQYGCTQGCLRHRRINSRQRKTDNMMERERDTGVGRGEMRECQAIKDGRSQFPQLAADSFPVLAILPFQADD